MAPARWCLVFQSFSGSTERHPEEAEQDGEPRDTGFAGELHQVALRELRASFIRSRAIRRDGSRIGSESGSKDGRSKGEV